MLSPFTVDASRDTGYQASSTLAGTRIRSDLRDLGTSVTVVTKDFLNDIGATDSESLLTFTAGTEVSGISGNFSSATLNLFGSVTDSAQQSGVGSPNRVRGLASADTSRDYFASSIPFDSYNTERVEINRGSNAILFGLGSPAGIINQGLLKPIYRNRYSTEFTFASFESHRESFDLNQVVSPGTLAIRVAGLNQQYNFRQDYAHEDARRIYGALLYEPKLFGQDSALGRTTLRASFESGKLRENRPHILPPGDGVTPWFQPYVAGQPVKASWSAGTQAFQNRPTLLFNTINDVFRNPNVVFQQPESSAPGVTGYPSGVIGFQGVISNAVTQLNGSPGTAVFVRLDRPSSVLPLAGNRDGSFFVEPVVTDPSIYDFRENLLEGPNKFNNTDFDTFTASLSQQFFKDAAGIELAYNREKLDNRFYSILSAGRAQTIMVDVNTTLIDGTPNPNFGRPFVASSGFRSRGRSERDDLRLTAYLDLDFRKYGKGNWQEWLGRHVFTFLHQRSDSEGWSANSQYQATTDSAFGSSTSRVNVNGPSLAAIHYLGPSLAAASSAAGAGISGIRAPQQPNSATIGSSRFRMRGQAVTSVFTDAALAVIDDDEEFSQLAQNGALNRNEVTSQAVVLQSYLLNDNLVGLFGWRRDELDAFSAGNPPAAPTGNLLVDQDNYRLPPAPTFSSGEETTTWSLVAHTPKKWLESVPVFSDLSVHYAESENFAPSGARFDAYGSLLAPSSGQNEEYGFTIGLLSNKIVLRGARYKTSQINVTGSGPTAQQIVTIHTNVINTTRLGLNPDSNGDGLPNGYVAPPQGLLDLFGFRRAADGTASFNARGDVVNTTSFEADGYEFELIARPAEGWDVALNAARQESVRSNSSAALEKLFYQDVQAGGSTLAANWLGATGAGLLVSTGTTLQSQATTLIDNGHRTVRLQDGAVVQELRKWRFNLVTNYRFASDGKLRGWNVGAGYRWQDKVAIGYPNIDGPGGSRIPDINNPFFGPSEENLDVWVGYSSKLLNDKLRWKALLRVRNLFDQDDLIPISTQPDGTIAGWRIQEGRTFELVNTFEF